ncbi:hypothetical protein [Streptomyces sp. 8N616]|uniref:hypothetical protein n=1 Tax=Streptomyces sp. 8N616 TaxID=3457414 RepID=UPI003FD2ADE2
MSARVELPAGRLARLHKPVQERAIGVFDDGPGVLSKPREDIEPEASGYAYGVPPLPGRAHGDDAARRQPFHGWCGPIAHPLRIV